MLEVLASTTWEAPVSEAYEGRQIVGMDLHRRRSVLVRMTEAGEHLETVRISNDPRYLAQVMARAGEAPEVVLEATYGWYWAADTLAELGATVHLAHPLGVKMFSYRRVKKDERDAADLADLLRMGQVRGIAFVVLHPPVGEHLHSQRVRQVHGGAELGQGVRGPVPAVRCLQNHLGCLAGAGHHLGQVPRIVGDPHRLQMLAGFGHAYQHRSASMQIHADDLSSLVCFAHR